MFKEGQRYKFYKIGAFGFKERKWVNAVVEHIPSHGLFVRFRMHFVNCFGERTSYVESFSMNELEQLQRKGELVQR